MTISSPLFYAVVFIAAVLVTWVALIQFVPTALDKRVKALNGAATTAGEPHEQGWLFESLSRWLAPLARASQPAEGWAKSPLRIRFYNAGIRSAGAPVVYLGAKTLLTFVLPGLMALAIWAAGTAWQPKPAVALAMLLLLAAIGYYLPNAVLAHMIARRQRDLFEAFPDALDLMRVCVESGQGLDAAIERVGREMALECPALSEELHLVSLELRAGASRADALRNLALRVALEDVDALVSMLVQADRFGTSVAESLRVHSESLRTKRRIGAEEAAAKLPVKLVFPLVFCVFPGLLTVLLGPAVITVYRLLITGLAGR